MYSPRILTKTVAHSLRQFSLQKINKTYVFQHVFLPERTPDDIQRRPEEKQEFQKYEVIEVQDETPVGPLKVILTEDVEGLGLEFDVIDVDRHLARNNLIPLKRAVYASPFDLAYYNKKKERMKDELAKRIRIPFDFIKLGRTLMSKVVPILISIENSWTLDRSIFLVSLMEADIIVEPETIYLPKEEIKGPNLNLEANLIRFYILIQKQYVVPMLGRINHISSDNSTENLYPERLSLPSNAQLKKFGLRPETPHYFQEPIDKIFDIVEFMASRKEEG